MSSPASPIPERTWYRISPIDETGVFLGLSLPQLIVGCVAALIGALMMVFVSVPLGVVTVIVFGGLALARHTGEPVLHLTPFEGIIIRHPAGPIIVDTGIGTGNEHIDNWYRPLTSDLRTKLTKRNIDPDSALTIVNTHLHFDHCGQNQSFPSATIYAQQAEIDMLASDPFYTVAAWAKMPHNRSTVIDGDQEIADGISVLHTPGHTPGHQSVVIRSNNETTK